MISFKLKALEKLAIDNSPALLTAIGVAGTIGTAILTHKAATKAEKYKARVYRQVDDGERFEPDKREMFDLVWKLYIPPAVSGTVTVGCVILSNRIGTKRAAAVAAAYAILETTSNEYRAKVVDQIGELKESKIRKELVEDRIRDNPLSESNVVIVGSGDVRCYDLYTGRYFNSSVEAIKKAVNEVNYTINTHGYASLSDFYTHLGIPRTVVSDEMGWTSDKLMDVDYTSVLSEDGQPCVAINFQIGPVRDYHRFH